MIVVVINQSPSGCTIHTYIYIHTYMSLHSCRENKHSLLPSLPFPSALTCLAACLSATISICLLSICIYLSSICLFCPTRLVITVVVVVFVVHTGPFPRPVPSLERERHLWIASLSLSSCNTTASCVSHPPPPPPPPVCHFTRIPIISRIPARLIIY